MANGELLRNFLKLMQTELKGNFPKAGMLKIMSDLAKEPDKAIMEAYDYFILHSTFLPSPAALLAKVQHYGRELRMMEAKQNEDEWNSTKPHRDEQTFLSREQRTEYGKRCQMIMNAATPLDANDMPRSHTQEELRVIVAACEQMEKSYTGEAESWCDLKMHFVKKGNYHHTLITD